MQISLKLIISEALPVYVQSVFTPENAPSFTQCLCVSKTLKIVRTCYFQTTSCINRSMTTSDNFNIVTMMV